MIIAILLLLYLHTILTLHYTTILLHLDWTRRTSSTPPVEEAWRALWTTAASPTPTPESSLRLPYALLLVGGVGCLWVSLAVMTSILLSWLQGIYRWDLYYYYCTILYKCTIQLYCTTILYNNLYYYDILLLQNFLSLPTVLHYMSVSLFPCFPLIFPIKWHILGRRRDHLWL